MRTDLYSMGSSADRLTQMLVRLQGRQGRPSKIQRILKDAVSILCFRRTERRQARRSGLVRPHVDPPTGSLPVRCPAKGDGALPQSCDLDPTDKLFDTSGLIHEVIQTGACVIPLRVARLLIPVRCKPVE